MEHKKFEIISEINVGNVFSNSFFFTSKKNLPITNQQFYMIKNVSNNEMIYFEVNTIKSNDTLYFFQNIDWITKKNRKIESGNYILNALVKNEE
nr:hypothetical protein [Gaetbulibacter sp. 4G1]